MVDYYSQAQQMYLPQLSYLDQQAAQAQQRAAQNSQEVKNLYDSLGNSTLGQEKGIANTYDTSLEGLKAAYSAAISGTNNAFDSSRDSNVGILERLGIQQAAPNVLDQNTQQRDLLTGIMRANEVASLNNLTTQKNSSIDYNRVLGNASKTRGTEAAQGINRSLEDFLMQLSGKKTDILSQILQTSQQMQASDASNLQKSMQDERDFNYRRAKDLADYDLRVRELAGKESKTSIDPLGKVNALAMQLYGGNTVAANNATDTILGAINEQSSTGEPVNYANVYRTMLKRIAGKNSNPNAVQDRNNLSRLLAVFMDGTN